VTRRTVVNMALLAAAVGLAALVYLLPAAKPAHPPSVLTRMTPGQVTRVQISRRGGPAIVLVRRGKRWRIAEPVKAQANRFIIHSLLGITRADSFGRFAAEGRDLREFGLDAPALRLRLNDLQIAFGAIEPLNGRRYVRIGAMVHVIPNYFYQEASGGVADFVSRTLLPEDSDPVRLALPDKVLQRDESGHWTLAGHGQGPAAQGGEDLVTRWRRARALDVKPYAGAGRHPTVTVTFDKGRPPLEFEIVSTAPTLILARPDIGMAYHFTASQADKLLRLPGPGAKKKDPHRSASE